MTQFDTDAAAALIDIQPDQWATLRQILRQQVPQYEVWAFGSRTKGKAKPYSDLDLVLITEQPVPLAVSAALSESFSESNLPWKVDVLDWSSANARWRKIIEQDRVVLQHPLADLI